MVIEKKVVYDPKSKDRYMSVTLSIWCMSPSIGFRLMAAGTRSVILASGESLMIVWIECSPLTLF